MVCKRKAVIFEGPAGSGKSYMIKHLAEHFGDKIYPEVGHLPEIDRPRAYISSHGLWHSQFKDHRSTLHMLMAEDQVSIIDRWGVSQQVYDAIRAKRSVVEPEALTYSLSMMVHSLQIAWAEHYARLDRTVPELEIDMLFIVVCSPGSLIDKLRASAIEKGRVYPYLAKDEASLYRQAAFALTQWSLDEIRRTNFVARIEVLPLYVTSLEQRFDHVLRSVQRLIDHDHLPSKSELPPIGLVVGRQDVELPAV